jgi:hypothetical protein
MKQKQLNLALNWFKAQHKNTEKLRKWTRYSGLTALKKIDSELVML